MGLLIDENFGLFGSRTLYVNEDGIFDVTPDNQIIGPCTNPSPGALKAHGRFCEYYKHMKKWVEE